MPYYPASSGGGGGTAATTTFDDTFISTASSGQVTGDDVQEIIDNQLVFLATLFTSIFTALGSLQADTVAFDNGSNGFAANDVQAAIEEAATGGGAVTSVNGDTGVVVLNQDDIGDGTTYKQYSDTEKSKLAGIEAGADVTDATNVAAAGAVMDTGDTMTGDLTITKPSPTLIMDRTNPAGTGIIEFQNSGVNAWRYGIYNGGSDSFMIHYTGTGGNHALEIDTSNILTITNLKIRTTLDANSHKINNVTDPTSAQDAATKNYVDTTVPVISSGTSAPATTPSKVGNIFVDTSAKKLYFATGTSSSADWTIAN